MFSPSEIAVIAMAFVLAGTVKGVVGIGLPTTAIGLLTLAHSPRTAIAIVLLPMLVSNGWQVWRSGNTRAVLRRYLPFALTLMVGVFVTVLMTKEAPDRVLFGVLGGALLVFVLLSVWQRLPSIPDNRDRPAQVIAGGLAGIVGGMTSVWGPPLLIYLGARRVPKAEFVAANGVLIFAGSVPLAIGYLQTGLFTRDLGMISALMLVPTLLGFTIGERLRAHLSEAAFRRFLLFVFFIMALNLLRRALF